SAEGALAALRRDDALRDAERTADEALRRCEELGAVALAPGDGAYPERLLELPQAPPVLFALGSLALLDAPCVAIVGTRDATAYGERATHEIGDALARAGVTIVSGLARGIDAAAHRAALDAGGGTIAVLGTGIDVVYPAAHRALHRAIAERGLLLSEELPGARPTPGSFPKRNRIIAALARATIVVEAGARSGALITAGHALELGRAVAAVPGRIDAPQSAGANLLLRDGAIVIAEVADALALVGAPPQPRPAPTLDDPAARAIWEALAHGSADMDTLAARAALPVRECLAAVASLELVGAVECTLAGEVRRR
ncbi:MAG TPA: DNA-processing protein DprA, partial [Gemmatimonadaceae bacterium]|nr:DNA-processing protein DprA [Gemmatimonadaceae bacterium]